MEVYFATKKLAGTLVHDGPRVRAYGAVVAKKLNLRLAQLSSAADLEGLRMAPGGCHELHENREGQLALDVTKNYRLIFRPTADPPLTKDDGGLDWSGVTEVTILEVTDYHGN